MAGTAAEPFYYNHTWGLIVPLLAALAPVWLIRIIPHPGWHPAFFALLLGAVVGVVSYSGLKAIGAQGVLTKAVLLGLLSAETTVLKAGTGLPSMSHLTLYLFFYYHTMEGH